jgi:hypothetical protein
MLRPRNPKRQRIAFCAIFSGGDSQLVRTLHRKTSKNQPLLRRAGVIDANYFLQKKTLQALRQLAKKEIEESLLHNVFNILNSRNLVNMQ